MIALGRGAWSAVISGEGTAVAVFSFPLVGRSRSRSWKPRIAAGAHKVKIIVDERSSHTWFVLTHLLGYPSIRNYDGSWTE